MEWTKGAPAISGKGNAWHTKAGPFTLNVVPKGDGRWNWSVLKEGTTNPVASGVVSSLGAAKTATENYVNRSGLL